MAPSAHSRSRSTRFTSACGDDFSPPTQISSALAPAAAPKSSICSAVNFFSVANWRWRAAVRCSGCSSSTFRLWRRLSSSRIPVEISSIGRSHPAASGCSLVVSRRRLHVKWNHIWHRQAYCFLRPDLASTSSFLRLDLASTSLLFPPV